MAGIAHEGVVVRNRLRNTHGVTIRSLAVRKRCGLCPGVSLDAPGIDSLKLQDTQDNYSRKHQSRCSDSPSSCGSQKGNPWQCPVKEPRRKDRRSNNPSTKTDNQDCADRRPSFPMPKNPQEADEHRNRYKESDSRVPGDLCHAECGLDFLNRKVGVELPPPTSWVVPQHDVDEGNDR